ncbi:hypothetical protein HY450_00705 [Candidatus Pacearchaeota archaeon]|nr:hypothetical protein [Candidatus Pacearchaeota archaeon]
MRVDYQSRKGERIRVAEEYFYEHRYFQHGNVPFPVDCQSIMVYVTRGKKFGEPKYSFLLGEDYEEGDKRRLRKAIHVAKQRQMNSRDLAELLRFIPKFESLIKEESVELDVVQQIYENRKVTKRHKK